MCAYAGSVHNSQLGVRSSLTSIRPANKTLVIVVPFTSTDIHHISTADIMHRNVSPRRCECRCHKGIGQPSSLSVNVSPTHSSDVQIMRQLCNIKCGAHAIARLWSCVHTMPRPRHVVQELLQHFCEPSRLVWHPTVQHWGVIETENETSDHLDYLNHAATERGVAQSVACQPLLQHCTVLPFAIAACPGQCTYMLL